MVAELLNKVRENHLSAPAAFFAADLSTLQKCCNGVGPECWPVLLRKLVSELLQIFAAGALIHDFEFSQSKKKLPPLYTGKYPSGIK